MDTNEGFTVRRLEPADAEAIASWRYRGRYATYDVREVVTPSQGFWAVVRGDDLVGYCCFGVEARVPEVEEEPDTLDVGYGMRPDLVGQGLGRSFVSSIVRFATDTFSPKRQRLLILRWNERSRKVAEGLGFRHRGHVRSKEGTFLVMVHDEVSS